MNKQSSAIVVVLVVLALVLGGVLAWMTAPEPDEIASPEPEDRVVATVDDAPIAASSDLEIPKSERVVEDYLNERFPGHGKELLNAVSTTPEGRPLYHSKTVFVSVDQDGNPRYTRPSWSPYDESQLTFADKQIDRSEYGQHQGPSIPVGAPSVKKLQEQADKRMEDAKLLQKWANEQVELGNVNDEGLPKLPKNMEGFINKLKLEERKEAEKKKKGNGQNGQNGKKKNKKKNQQAPSVQGPKKNN